MDNEVHYMSVANDQYTYVVIRYHYLSIETRVQVTGVKRWSSVFVLDMGPKGKGVLGSSQNRRKFGDK